MHVDQSPMTVYPRVGGGTGVPTVFAYLVLGLSPRGRGNPLPGHLPALPARSIPAWAGEPRIIVGSTLLNEVYPRVGGGTTLALNAGLNLHGLSPRGRGNQRRPV